MENGGLKMDMIPGREKVEVILKHEDNNSQGIEISLRDIIETVIKGKWLIAVITAVSLIATVIGTAYTSPYKGKTSMIISFNFDGIEKGIDPYGRSFDVSKIKAPVVIDKVVDELGLQKQKITTENIRSNIEIVPVIPGDITQKIEDLQEAKKQNISETQDFTYYPNIFVLTLNIPRSFDITDTKAQEILNEIYKQYREYFYYSYSDKSVLSNALGAIDYNEYDYPEISTVIHNQINIITNYLSAKNKETGAGVFRSKKTGLAFNDIAESVNILAKVDLNRIDSIIGSYNLTKNKEKLIKLYEYRIQMNDLETAKKNDEASVYNGMLGKYQKDKSILLVPGITQGQGSESTLETSQASQYYDELMDKTAAAGVVAKNTLHDSEYYKAQIVKLQNDTVAPELKQAAEKDIMGLIPVIKTKLENWINLTNDTVAEYYETQLYNTAVKSLSPADYSGALGSMKLYLVIALVVGLMVGLFAAFFREYWRRSGNKFLLNKREESV